jgi:exodeoxyribonuclease VII small subunit
MTPKAGSKTPPPGPPDAPTFEAALARLEEIVGRLEEGEITLDESLEAFKEGSALVRQCLDRLAAAETAVRELVAGEDGAPQLRPAALAERSGGPGDA